MIIPLLEAQNLTYTLHLTPLFSRLNFVLMPGEVLQVVGNNGSGKTSLLRLLSGLLPVEEGKVKCRAEPLLYVGHKLGIKLGLTIRENLREIAVLHGVFNPLHLVEALEKFELTAIADLPCAYLSAGQRQRVALSRLLILKSLLWILDEPFAHLDKKSCDLMMECIREQCERGGGVVMAVHQALPFVMNQQPILHLL